MLRRLLATFLIVSTAIPAQATGLRFHCLVTGDRDLTSCCCTGSMTEACGGNAKRVAEPKSCGS